MPPPRVLTIAGSDPSGGAGIQADLKTIHALGCYGMAVVTALTAQNTVGVTGVHPVPAPFVAQQVDTLLADCPPAASKTGMLFSAELVAVVAPRGAGGRLGALVVDPVMVATSGDRLLEPAAEDALRGSLVPVATVVTPNRAEAEVLTGRTISGVDEAVAAARTLVAMGAGAALVKGGHDDDPARATDVLVTRDGEVATWTRPRIALEAHGTGCTLSAAVACGLAAGLPLSEACRRAGDFVHLGLAGSFAVGRGARPVNHLAAGDGGARA